MEWNLIARLYKSALLIVGLAYACSNPLAATLSLNANPVSVPSGAPSTITWSSTDASNCSALGAWSGVKAASGSQSIVVPNGLNSYILNCSGPSGGASNSVVIGAGTPAPPVYALNVTLSGSGTVTSNPSGITCGATCSANYPAGAAVNLSATPAAGNAFTGWSGACSGSGACVATMSANRAVTAMFSPPSSDLLFFDNFEYSVDRNDTNAATRFQQIGGWTGAKTEQSGEPGANGYLYTVTSIPGYTGAFPGGASSRVLAIEALPGSEGFQTDFYLEYGDGENPAYDNKIPGNVWFQFWIYINYYGDQLSRVDGRNKFIYPCNGSYPCQTGKWLVSLINNSYEPFWVSLGTPSSVGGFLMNAANVFGDIATVTNTNAATFDDRYKLGHTNVSERIAINRWTLVKIHVDTSTQSGKYETWMRPMGGAWTKVAEWIDGVTPGFTWTISPAHVGGHRTIRMPSTMGRVSGSGYDSWYYMDDFAIARTEAALPQYSQ